VILYRIVLTIIAKNLETVDQVRFIFSTHKSLRQLGTVPTIWENLLIHEKPRRNICRGFSDKIVPNLPGGCVRNLSIHCIGGKVSSFYHAYLVAIRFIISYRLLFILTF
jgi:hypothetical protein